MNAHVRLHARLHLTILRRTHIETSILEWRKTSGKRRTNKKFVYLRQLKRLAAEILEPVAYLSAHTDRIHCHLYTISPSRAPHRPNRNSIPGGPRCVAPYDSVCEPLIILILAQCLQDEVKKETNKKTIEINSKQYYDWCIMFSFFIMYYYIYIFWQCPLPHLRYLVAE